MKFIDVIGKQITSDKRLGGAGGLAFWFNGRSGGRDESGCGGFCRILQTAMLLMWFVLPFVQAGDVVDVRGYERTIAGTSMKYHAPWPEDTNALIVRARADFPAIEWETGALPTASTTGQIRYTWAFGLSVNSQGHGYHLAVNGTRLLVFNSPASGKLVPWSIKGDHGSRIDFRPTLADIHGNLQGYASLTIPRSVLGGAETAKIQVVGGDHGANAFYMTFERAIGESVSIRQMPVVLKARDGGGPSHLVVLDIMSLTHTGPSLVKVGDMEEQAFDLKLGANQVEIPIPVARGLGAMVATLRFAGQAEQSVGFTLDSVSEWSLDLIQQTHTDIGYTRPQIEILPEHLRYIDYVLDYCDQTDGLPDDAKFRWTCESSWAVREYLKCRPVSQIERLRSRVAEGRVEVAGLFFNMSEIAGESGLVAMLQPLGEFRKHGIPVQTAMQNDVNGIGWGLAEHFPALGIRYLFMGEHSHRAILPFKRPTAFWWESPSGKRTLAFRAEHYMIGNRMGFGTMEMESLAPRVFAYLNQLAASGYPFHRMGIQMSGVFTDNSPPSTKVCSLVKQWNDRYQWPRLRMSTAGEFMSYVERNHGEKLPVHRVAWPDWWTDGFGTAARETAASRETSSVLNAQESLLAMARLRGEVLPSTLPGDLRRIREQLLFYDEHTFGASESITDPRSENSMIQWAQKGSYVWEAVKGAGMLNEVSMGFLQQGLPVAEVPVITVFNTLNWPRCGVVEVFIDHEQLDPGRGFKIVDSSGGEIPAQRVGSRSEGSYWALGVRDVPSCGFTSYRILQDTAAAAKLMRAEAFDRNFESRHYRVGFDENNQISSILDKELGLELLDASPEWKAGQVIHERLGNRDQLERFTLESCERSAVKRMEFVSLERGGVWDTLRLKGGLPNTCDSRGVEVEMRLHHPTRRIEWIYRMHKLPVESPESIYVAFPFGLANGRLSFEAQGAMIEPGVGQLEGTSSDWNTVQSVVSVANERAAIHWSSPEIPLAHLGGLNIGRFAYHTGVSRPHVYSWVLNNYWTTNFRVSQEGELRWSYVMGSTSRPDDAVATRFGWENRIPMPARVQAPGKSRGDLRGGSVLQLPCDNLLLVNSTITEDGDGVVLHLREISGKAHDLKLDGIVPSLPGATVCEVDAVGNPLGGGGSVLRINPCETKFVRVSAGAR